MASSGSHAPGLSSQVPDVSNRGTGSTGTSLLLGSPPLHGLFRQVLRSPTVPNTCNIVCGNVSTLTHLSLVRHRTIPLHPHVFSAAAPVFGRLLQHNLKYPSPLLTMLSSTPLGADHSSLKSHPHKCKNFLNHCLGVPLHVLLHTLYSLTLYLL